MKHIKPLILEKSEDFIAKHHEGTPDAKDTSDSQLTVYKVTTRDPEGTVKSMLEYIGKIGNGGHSFKIVIDPSSKGDHRKEFYWDGDGGVWLKEVETLSEPKKKKSAEEIPSDKEEAEEKPEKSTEPSESTEEKSEEPAKEDGKKD